jgi:hypothetical protein
MIQQPWEGPAKQRKRSKTVTTAVKEGYEVCKTERRLTR